MRKLKLLFFLGFLMGFYFTVDAQFIKTKLDFVGGLSYPEFLHGGVRYQYSDIAQAGLYYGGDMGIKPTIIRTWTADNMIHFGNISYHSNRPVWYARQGLTYSIHTEDDRIYKYSLINMGLGRDVQLNNRIGFNMDMGLILQVREKMEYRDTSLDPWYKTKWIWKYLFRFQIYISI